MVLLAPVSDTRPGEIAERIRAAVEAMVIRLDDGTELRCTVSAGYSHVAGRGATWERLIAQADGALYAAKAAGRNQVVNHVRVAA